MPGSESTSDQIVDQVPDRPVMSADQLATERRQGRIAGIAVLVTVALVLGGALWSSSIDTNDTGGKPTIARPAPTPAAQAARDIKAKSKHKHAKPTAAQIKKAKTEIKDQKNRVKDLAVVDRNASKFTLIAILEALALSLLLFPTLFIYRATRARRPETLRLLGYAAVVGSLAIGASLLVRTFALKHAATDFVGQRYDTLQAASDRAEHLLKSGAFSVSQGLIFIGVVALVFWLIKGNYDAFGIGLMQRSLGILGMAVPLLFFIFAPVALFWLLAIGGLCFGFWPGGLPPAWTEGRAIPWPRREPGAGRGVGSKPAGGERNGEVDAIGPGVKDEPTAQVTSGDGSGAKGTPRKRKRRK